MRVILCFFLGLALIAFAGKTHARSSQDGVVETSGDLEREFAVQVRQVQDQILDAPEASRVYLVYWTRVYNRSVRDEENERLRIVDHSVKPDENAVDFSSTIYLNANRDLGVWHPNGYPVVSPEWAHKTPFSFQSPSQFRPPAPPDMNDPAFQKDLQDVRLMGDLHSSVRTPKQSLISAFWANGPGTETPPGRWNLIGLQNSRHLPPAERLEMMLALNIALYDAGIAAWDAKFHYNYWRPQTAISAIFPEDIDWEPMMQPPFHPEYVSGHSTFSGAAAQILEHYLGPVDFCITAKELADLKRCYERFGEAANEAGRSRIYGGIHYQFSNVAGLNLGRDIGQHVISSIDFIMQTPKK